MISGAMRERNMKYVRQVSEEILLSRMKGIFGWTEIQVHVNVVVRQLHRMTQSDRFPYVPAVEAISIARS